MKDISVPQPPASPHLVDVICERSHTHLVDGRLDLGDGIDLPQLLHAEVADADALGKALGLHSLHLLGTRVIGD